ncbi:flp/Fap pilin component family protein [Collimonas fungivorans]|uniref:Flp/Fap pilin component family protein n=1 Tax=Collimonas fungivorans TaxID=158899 RepID=A0A127P7V9_9BURK|nr:Flp family type IVb pilin [Collimonas fungivorans]AMO93838.1 flp/Fap pilin component family protein [Collimonas fungivorans]
MNAKLMKFLRDEDGVTAIEYGLIAGLVAVAIILGATALGGSLGTIFTNIGTKITNIAATIGA